ncbi:hypothetical protein Tco_1569822, partial [Tanacetum coccineum]
MVAISGNSSGTQDGNVVSSTATSVKGNVTDSSSDPNNLAHDGLGGADCTLAKVSLIPLGKDAGSKGPRPLAGSKGSALCGVKGQSPLLGSRSQVVYVLSTPMPEFVEDESLEQTRRQCKWENDDYICRGHILKGMSDALFDVYQNMGSTKELLDQIESKYMAEDASNKKFLVSNFNNYKMVDSRYVMEQYLEILRILGQFTQHGLNMDKSISVSSIIDKLPPSWKD